MNRPHNVTAATVAVRPARSAPALPAVVSPRGGDAAAESTRDSAQHPGRVAPAPIQALARITVLGLGFWLIHAAAAHPLSALALAVAMLVVALAPSRR